MLESHQSLPGAGDGLGKRACSRTSRHLCSSRGTWLAVTEHLHAAVTDARSWLGPGTKTCIVPVPQTVAEYLGWAGPLEDAKMNQCKTQLQKNPLPKREKYRDRETITFR